MQAYCVKCRAKREMKDAIASSDITKAPFVKYSTECSYEGAIRLLTFRMRLVYASTSERG